MDSERDWDRAPGGLGLGGLAIDLPAPPLPLPASSSPLPSSPAPSQTRSQIAQTTARPRRRQRVLRGVRERLDVAKMLDS